MKAMRTCGRQDGEWLMNLQRPGKSRGVIEPAGKPLKNDDIRKCEVAASVRHGLINLEEACNHYKLSVDEVLAWLRVLEVHAGRGNTVSGKSQASR